MTAAAPKRALEIPARTFRSADEAVEAVLEVLHDVLDMEVVHVSRITDTVQQILAASDRQDMGLRSGQELPIEATFCHRALTTDVPPMTADAANSPYADLPSRTELGATSYVMVPLFFSNGRLFGTMCGLDRRPISVSEEQRQLMAILGGVLAREFEIEALRKREASARKTLEQTLERERNASLYDPLTGVATRVLLFDRMRQAFARAERTSRPLGLLCLDIDGFGVVNDEFGDAAGDRVLAAVARRLEEATRPEDTVARLGSDEFAVLTERIGDAGQIAAVAQRVCGGLHEPVELGEGKVNLSVSVGVALSGPTAADPHVLLTEAQDALARAKTRPGKGAR